MEIFWGKLLFLYSPHKRVSKFRNRGNFCLWHPKDEKLSCGIRNPELWNQEYSSRNPESRVPLTKNRNPVPAIRNPRRGIQQKIRLSCNWIPLHGTICIFPDTSRTSWIAAGSWMSRLIEHFGRPWSHTTNLNAFVLTPAARKRENINFRLPFLTFGTPTFSLLKVPDDGLPMVPYSKLSHMSWKHRLKATSPLSRFIGQPYNFL